MTPFWEINKQIFLRQFCVKKYHNIKLKTNVLVDMYLMKQVSIIYNREKKTLQNKYFFFNNLYLE